MPDEQSMVLRQEEIKDITGYKRPGDQLAELKAQGFYRARHHPVTGKVILERAHYEHVCAGGAEPANEPQVQPLSRKRA